MKFEDVEKFIYLLSLISNRYEEENEVNVRLMKENQKHMYHYLPPSIYQEILNLEFLKLIFRPTALYGCKNRIFEQTDRAEISKMGRGGAKKNIRIEEN